MGCGSGSGDSDVADEGIGEKRERAEREGGKERENGVWLKKIEKLPLIYEIMREDRMERARTMTLSLIHI